MPTTPTTRSTQSRTGEARETNASALVTTETHPDTEGADVGNSDPFAGTTAGDPTEGGMSQSRIDAMVAEFMPGYGGAKCRLEGFLLGCGFFKGMLSSGMIAPGKEPGACSLSTAAASAGTWGWRCGTRRQRRWAWTSSAADAVEIRRPARHLVRSKRRDVGLNT
jgi:hypothetical protein